MTTRTTVLQVLRDLEIEVGSVEDTTRLREDLGVDSTELIEVAVAIDQRTSAKSDVNEVLALKTFGDLVSYVDSAPRK